jgi:hypothetical protein
MPCASVTTDNSIMFKKNLKILVTDGNKSLYLVFVGVVFLSILDCFYSS